MRPIGATFVALFLAISPSMARDTKAGHVSGMDHNAMMTGTLPGEAGQSAFAAIQEIVTILQNDPATDWSKVNIEALRQHLIEMNNVTMSATVVTTEQPGSIRFAASGDGPVRDSIQRMVTAHAAAMNGAGGWEQTAEKSAAGATLTVKVTDPTSLQELRGLGFIGVLAMGMNHQMHHLMIAKGMSPHM